MTGLPAPRETVKTKKVVSNHTIVGHVRDEARSLSVTKDENLAD